MKEVILDGADMTTLADLHTQLAERLELPDHYGANLDALWDALTGGIALPLIIRWVNFGASRNRLGNDAERVLDLLREAEQELAGLLVIIVENAVKGDGC
ncbi:barstar family protein [Paenibacillus daejeonensis]|uniref:barstar family protein n=1 Tax=Paenibacillus daejeonensis TaxID=135193 RepID=UPI00036565BF|nr:barstar family protein [Paenibacillus daejeonensis]